MLVIRLVMLLAVVAMSLWSRSAPAIKASASEMEAAASWVTDVFDPESPALPFSFVYGGRSSSEILADWTAAQPEVTSEDGKTLTIRRYRDEDTGLEVACELTTYDDFPAADWLLRITNHGDADTPILEDIQALDTHGERREGKEFVLHRALGSDARRSDFAPVREVLAPDSVTRIATRNGRSSHTNSLPFFNIEGVGEGVVLAIGWSGQWAMTLARDGGTDLHARAGMELTHLRLHPGEQIRSPRILLIFWHGDDRMRGHNLLRRFILAHNSPQEDGKPFLGPLTFTGHPGFGAEFNNATEYNQLASVERYRQFGLDAEYLWIDAGWYEGYWPNGVGNWFPRKNGLPNGLRPISDGLKDMGFKGLLLWFEPERVHQGTAIDREHPEWVLKHPGNPNGLFDLANPDARDWLTDHISGLIQSQGIAIYRQDCNIDPLSFWRAADEPDRQGIHEIRHIENLYKFWDELLRRNPGLVIDNCASGGRRIDLETTARSIPLWRTDYHYHEPNGYQCHTYGLNFFVPLSGTGGGPPDAYRLRSAMNSASQLPWNVWEGGFPVDEARRRIAEIKRVRHYFLGDYYPLTEHRTTDDVWMAYQFHRDDLSEGMFLAFRRSDSPDTSAILRLGGLEASSSYELQFEDSGVTQTYSGETLREGVEVVIDAAPGSLLVTYREAGSG